MKIFSLLNFLILQGDGAPPVINQSTLILLLILLSIMGVPLLIFYLRKTKKRDA